MAHSEFSNDIGLSAIIAEEAVSLAMLNAVQRQQQDGILAQAVTATCATAILSLIPAEIASPEVPAALASAGVSVESGASAESGGAPTLGGATASESIAADDMDARAGAPQDILDGALRMMALTIALTVQDAANYLRNVQTLSTASIACSLVPPEAEQHVSKDIPPAILAVERCASQFQDFCSRTTVILGELQSLRASGSASETGWGETRGAIAELLQGTARALSTAAQNAASGQQQNEVTAQAATVMGVATLYSVDTAALGESVEKILNRTKAAVPETASEPAVA